MTLAQKNSYGELSYLSFAERLKSMDFPNNLDATQSKRLAVDEWGTLAKTQADMVDAYEQQQAQIALDSRVQNRKQLRIQADNKEQQQKAKQRGHKEKEEHKNSKATTKIEEGNTEKQ